MGGGGSEGGKVHGRTFSSGKTKDKWNSNSNRKFISLLVTWR